MSEDLLNRLQSQRSQAQTNRKADVDRRGGYSAFGEKTYPYEDTFRSLFGNLDFPEGLGFSGLLTERANRLGRPQLVLDLMAPPSSFLSELASSHGGFGGGVAVTLGSEQDPPGRKEVVSGKDIYAVSGDLLQGSTWQRIDQGLAAIGKPNAKFDVITCRPERPFISYPWVNPSATGIFGPQDLPLLVIPFQKAWDRLSSEDGMIFAQLPIMHKFSPGYKPYRDIVERLEDNARILGVEVKVGFNDETPVDAKPILRITRAHSSPADFPKRLARNL